MLLVSPVALLTRPRIPVSVCFPTGISSCAWLSFLLHMKIPINGMLAITLSLITARLSSKAPRFTGLGRQVQAKEELPLPAVNQWQQSYEPRWYRGGMIPVSAIARQVLHLQVCPRLKAAHKNFLFARPPVLSAARVSAAQCRS